MRDIKEPDIQCARVVKDAASIDIQLPRLPKSQKFAVQVLVNGRPATETERMMYEVGRLDGSAEHDLDKRLEGIDALPF